MRMDSQAKYACLARGEGGIYFRTPKDTSYHEKIWVSDSVTLSTLFNGRLTCPFRPFVNLGSR
jgi:hypothetical protein